VSKKNWALILVAALALLAGLAAAPQASSDGGDELVAVLAQPVPDGFSDGGDGLVRVLVHPDGFSDGGDGLVAVWATPAPPETPGGG
jgi:hypothetical protein